MILLTDASVDPQSGIGFGAYLAFSDLSESLDLLCERIQLRKFEQTTSSKLELQTLLWALSEMPQTDIVAFTDSQNIIGLLVRKERLVANDFCSKCGRLIRNHQLYREFFESVGERDIQFHRIKGHQPSHSKDRIDEVFTRVDRASRKALRAYIKETPEIV